MSTAQETSLLEHALNYAARGWHIMPLHTITEQEPLEGEPPLPTCTCGNPGCASPGKHPRTRNGLLDATTDPSQITAWWRKWPDANIGVRTGNTSGIYVIDSDINKGGAATISQLEQQHGKFRTYETMTGSGGKHYVFQHPGGELRNTTSVLGPGVDTRGDGGYIVAPPSLHDSGRPYKLLHDRPPAELPGSLLEQLRNTERPRATILEPEQPIPAGQRNQTLTSLAGTLRRRGLAAGEILASLRAINTTRCQPPLSEDELDTISRSVSRYPPAAPLPTETPEPGSPAELFFTWLQDFLDQDDEHATPLLGNHDETIIPEGGIAIIAGNPGIGKTTLALDLALHLAAGQPWLGLHTPQPLRILWIENEGPQPFFRKKVRTKIQGFPHTIPDHGFAIKTANWGNFSFLASSDRGRLATSINEHQFDIVFGDPLGSLGTTGVGSPDDTREFIRNLKGVGLGQTAFVFLHHFRKEPTPGEEANQVSGSWGGHLDALLLVKAGKHTDELRLSYPKIRWAGAGERKPMILGMLRNTQGFELLGEEGDSSLLERSIVELLEDGVWRTSTEIASKDEGIGARKKDVVDALHGNEHLFRNEAGNHHGRKANAIMWQLFREHGNTTEQSEQFGPPGRGDDGESNCSPLYIGEQLDTSSSRAEPNRSHPTDPREQEQYGEQYDDGMEWR